MRQMKCISYTIMDQTKDGARNASGWYRFSRRGIMQKLSARIARQKLFIRHPGNVRHLRQKSTMLKLYRKCRADLWSGAYIKGRISEEIIKNREYLRTNTKGSLYGTMGHHGNMITTCTKINISVGSGIKIILPERAKHFTGRHGQNCTNVTGPT